MKVYLIIDELEGAVDQWALTVLGVTSTRSEAERRAKLVGSSEVFEADVDKPIFIPPKGTWLYRVTQIPGSGIDGAEACRVGFLEMQDRQQEDGWEASRNGVVSFHFAKSKEEAIKKAVSGLSEEMTERYESIVENHKRICQQIEQLTPTERIMLLNQ